jgi:uncharacterized membrane protein YtjA (UPF0391 family)
MVAQTQYEFQERCGLTATRLAAAVGNRNLSAETALPRHGFNAVTEEGPVMMGWAVTFLIVALIAAVLGFGGIAGVAIEAAKLVFFVAIILFAISAVVGLLRGRTPSVP